jgi:hypothetical protein
MNNHHDREIRQRGSLVGPLILIGLGIIFLLSNLGLMTGDVWDTIARLWPLILVAIGLDGILRRGGLVGSVLMIGLGIVFLLSNYGLLLLNVWEIILNLWPILLIAIGFDVFFGRRSIWASLAALAIVIVILIGALWAFGIGINTGRPVAGEQITQALDSATQASIVLDPGVGSIHVNALEQSGVLLEGRVSTSRGQQVNQDFSRDGDTANLSLKMTGNNFVYFPGRTNQWVWDLGVTPDVPVSLKVNLGAGEVNLDGTNLDLSDLNVDLGVGLARLDLPATGNFNAKVSGAIGQIEVGIPQGMAVRIKSSTAISNISVPPDFEKLGDVYSSPGFATAESRVELQLSEAIGSISVHYK